MRELLPAIDQWHLDGKRVAIATVVKVWGSAPRPVGSKMVVSSSGGMQGSVSGGCVEGAVFEAAHEVIAAGRPRLLSFGVSDDDAWAVGLSCGGEIEVFVEPVLPELPSGGSPTLFTEVRRRLDTERTVVVATVVEGPGVGRQLVLEPWGERVAGDLGDARLETAVRAHAATLLRGFRCGKITLAAETGLAGVFIEVHGPRPQLVVVGAVHVAVPLIHFARLLGWRAIVVDPRPVFATAERFAHADALIVEWPQDAFAQIHLHDNTYVAVLSHDLKIDIPALVAALRRQLPYVGALGSRKTQAKRTRALLEEGLTEEELAPLRSPIGLDLGGRRAEEVALSVIAEIVAVTQQGAAAAQTSNEAARRA